MIARRSLLPSLSLGLGVSYTPDAAGFSPQTSHGNRHRRRFAIPLFRWRTFPAPASPQARANVATQEITRRASVDQVTLDVRQAYSQFNAVSQQRRCRERRRDAGAGSVPIWREFGTRQGVAGQVGISPQVEVSNAQTALTQAESNQVNALYDYNNARATLDRAIGRYSYVPVGPGYAAPPPPKTTGAPTTNSQGDRR